MSDKCVLDCRGLSCPQPVIETKKALEAQKAPFAVLVDNEAARENVGKFAASQGCAVQVTQEGNFFRLEVSAPGGTAVAAAQAAPMAAGTAPLRYLLTRETLGHGSDELGAVLVKSFLVAVKEKTPLPAGILMINGAVKLACAGSPVLESLQELARQGVEVLACGTCLDYYGLKEELRVGAVTNMYSLVDLMAAGPLITL